MDGLEIDVEYCGCVALKESTRSMEQSIREQLIFAAIYDLRRDSIGRNVDMYKNARKELSPFLGNKHNTKKIYKDESHLVLNRNRINIKSERYEIEHSNSKVSYHASSVAHPNYFLWVGKDATKGRMTGRALFLIKSLRNNRKHITDTFRKIFQ